MRILILGGSGMLGHKLWQVAREQHDAWVALRGGLDGFVRFGLFDPARAITDIDAHRFDSIVGAVSRISPDVVVNCIGAVKQTALGQDPIEALTINAVLPQQLAQLCRESGVRLIHISTDCAFSGSKGGYSETDAPDPTDLYGRSKLLGEVTDPGCLTLRTSMIGRELRTCHGLLEWFLSQRTGRVRGYRAAVFSGLTTLTFSRLIVDVAASRPDLWGLYHVAAEPINKYDLLCTIRDTLCLPVHIEPSYDLQIDRSLDGTRFRQETGFVAPSWLDMIRELVADPTPYDQWRSAAWAPA